jgi:hypothetical protein
MHLVQGLLHVLHMRRPILQQGRTVTQVGSHGAHLGLGATRAAQQTTRMPVLNPLTVLHIALPSRYMLQVARIDQVHFEAPSLEHLVHGNPLHPGGFHRHRLNPAGVQPDGQRLEVRGKRPERPHRLGIAVLRHTGPARLAANIQPGRVRVDTGARGGPWRSRAAHTPRQTSRVKGHPCLQPRSGHLLRSGSTRSSLSPSAATSPHLTPDQHQSRQRAVLHTSLCTVFACLNAGHQYTSLCPRCCQQAYRVAVWNSRKSVSLPAYTWGT